MFTQLLVQQGKERKGDLRNSLNHHWKELAHKQVGNWELHKPNHCKRSWSFYKMNFNTTKLFFSETIKPFLHTELPLFLFKFRLSVLNIKGILIY